ncbi:hypothetical protein V565_122230 [Rhizoctonia solani 123E]|uniref:Suppressor of white apricot N-terminal domain-containing protein n=1 Tax=Rhizoctonia solani 123E TaxID=1423351 RepID=A0A074RNT5_9AGAM|nr:hypothetical protein V565_122230 [Rhizoctonia solani 123E]
MSGNKRKRNSRSSPRPRYTSPELPLHARPLRIQAYEAELVRNRPNLSDQLESRTEGGNRGGLIRWGDHDIWVDRYVTESQANNPHLLHFNNLEGSNLDCNGSTTLFHMFIDRIHAILTLMHRFDVRLLLDSLDNVATPASIQLDSLNEPPADVGWDDLPSDAEDTFFLTPKEVDEYQHDKRRKMLEQGRQDRLRALAEANEINDPGVIPEALWGGSDEEPDDAQANLMRRTAAHIRASPNPTQLEMRIFANHGADPRFAFLRGRWKRAWARVRQEQEQETPPNTETKKSVMGGLSTYASDSDSDQKSRGDEESDPHVVQEVSPEHDEMEKVKAERRARAKEWARKRKASQPNEGGLGS